MTSPTDHELMRRCAAGDALGFELLVRRWEGRIGRVLRRLVRCEAEVQDLAQEVFLRVLTAAGRYRPEHAFSTWIYRITLNVARDAARRRRGAAPLENGQPADTAPPADDVAMRRELAGHVEAALGELPGKLREVLVLRHYADMTFGQIAEVTGTATSTVKSRAQVALTRLRQELNRRGIDNGELEP